MQLVMRSVASASVCVCLSLCPVRDLTSERFDLGTSHWCAGTSLDYLGRVRISMSSGRGQRSQKQKGHLGVTKYTHSRVVCLRLKGNLIIMLSSRKVPDRY